VYLFNFILFLMKIYCSNFAQLLYAVNSEQIIQKARQQYCIYSYILSTRDTVKINTRNEFIIIELIRWSILCFEGFQLKRDYSDNCNNKSRRRQLLKVKTVLEIIEKNMIFKKRFTKSIVFIIRQYLLDTNTH